MERPQFTAWITVGALAHGIQEKRVELAFDTMVSVVGNGYQHYHGEGKEWHRTLEGAVKRAEEMRVAEIGLLKKQIAKLEKLRFE